MFAKDLDAGENGTVTFSLVTGELVQCLSSVQAELRLLKAEFHHLVYLWVILGEEGFGHFEIDSESGDIRTTELFTQDTEAYYTLKIRARDSGNPSLEDTAVIHVQVQSFLYSKFKFSYGFKVKFQIRRQILKCYLLWNHTGGSILQSLPLSLFSLCIFISKHCDFSIICTVH